MTSANFEALATYILTQNTYFDKGFALAYKDEQTRRIMHRGVSGDLTDLSFTDTLGSYFYIRTDGDIRISQNIQMADCGIVAYSDVLRCQLVAVVNDANAFTLLNNLRATTNMFTELTCIDSGASVIRENIVRSELTGVSGKDIEAILQRLKKQTIVRLTIDVQQYYKPANCIVDVCTC